MKRIAESHIQQQSVIHFTNTYCLKTHTPRCMIFSVPNESENSWETQKKVNTGLMRGAADCIILLPDAQLLFMECKSATGVQSPAQKSFQERVEALGFKYFVYHSLEQFKQIIKPYITWRSEF